VAAHARNEVRQARRQQRETEDEACLFNAAHAAAKGSEDVDLPASHGADRQLRRAAIDAHVARQVALLMGSLLGPAYRPGVPPPGMSYAVDVQPSVALGPEAGRGLIVRGACQPGDVVAFYPGTVYTPAEVAEQTLNTMQEHSIHVPTMPSFDPSSCSEHLLLRLTWLVTHMGLRSVSFMFRCAL